jgi:hypothetical protein
MVVTQLLVLMQRHLVEKQGAVQEVVDLVVVLHMVDPAQTQLVFKGVAVFLTLAAAAVIVLKRKLVAHRLWVAAVVEPQDGMEQLTVQVLEVYRLLVVLGALVLIRLVQLLALNPLVAGAVCWMMLNLEELVALVVTVKQLFIHGEVADALRKN